MATSVQIISGGTTYHLHNSSKAPTTGGALTAASTTPLVVEDEWRLSAVTGDEERVTETPTLLCYGSSHDNVASIVRTLRQVMNTALSGIPAILVIQPDGATSALYFEVYRADIQEEKIHDEDGFESPLEGTARVRLHLTLVRSPSGGRLTTPETLINAVSYQSRFSGSPDADSAYSTGGGDRIHEGQPLNIYADNTTVGVTLSNWLIASCRPYAVTATTQTVTTSSTTGTTASAALNSQLTIGATYNTYQKIRFRLLAQTTAATTGSQFRALISTLAPNLYATYPTAGEQIIYTSPWFTSSNAAQMVDCGTIPVDFLKDTLVQGVYALLQVRSPAGTSVTVTLSNWVVIPYFTICRSTPALVVSNSPAGRLRLDSFIRPVSGGPSDRPNLPMARPTLYVTADTDTIQLANSPIIGTAPTYVSGASLLVIPQISFPPSTSVAYATTHTYEVTATHAPLFDTYRGNG